MNSAAKISQTALASLLVAGCLSSCRDPEMRPDEDDDSEFPGEEGDLYRLANEIGPMPSSFESHPPTCEEDLPLEHLPIRLFDDDGHLFYFEVTPEAAAAGDEKACKKDVPPDGVSCPNSAENVRIVPFGMNVCADTGKIEVDLRGGDRFRTWLGIPTLKFDSGEFADQSFADGNSQLRLHNGQGGRSLLREAVALRIWEALGFPVPRSSFVKTRSNVWDSTIEPSTWAAHLLVQAYKKKFFDDQLPHVVSVWEGDGDVLGSGWDKVDCEWSAEDECNDATLTSVVEDLKAIPSGHGYFEATKDHVDWDNVHAFQCLSALTDTGLDWAHESENVVLFLTEDRKLGFLPYNMDTSGGWLADEGTPTPYEGETTLLRRCAEDEECVEHGRALCEDLLDAFETLDAPKNIVDERCDTLEALGLMRTGDEEACQSIRSYYSEAAERVRSELQEL